METWTASTVEKYVVIASPHLKQLCKKCTERNLFAMHYYFCLNTQKYMRRGPGLNASILATRRCPSVDLPSNPVSVTVSCCAFKFISFSTAQSQPSCCSHAQMNGSGNAARSAKGYTFGHIHSSVHSAAQTTRIAAVYLAMDAFQQEECSKQAQGSQVKALGSKGRSSTFCLRKGLKSSRNTKFNHNEHQKLSKTHCTLW